MRVLNDMKKDLFYMQKNEKGFTLAEVLITLGIVGVVAALILPPVINDIKDREYATARKRMLSTLGEAVRRQAIQGDLKDAVDAEDYVENILKKQLKIIKTCDNAHLRECGIETDENKIFNQSEQKTTMPTKISDLASGIAQYGVTLKGKGDMTSYGLVMQNGYSVNLFYNPNCMSDRETAYFVQDSVCVNAIYDINGLSKPNQAGKDIGFVTILFPNEESTMVAPDIYKSDMPTYDVTMNTPCKSLGKEYSVPTFNELISMYYNMNLYGVSSNFYFSKTTTPSGLVWRIYTGNGLKTPPNNMSGYKVVRCVRNY